MEKNAQYWIDRLRLSPHPEGGYYRVTYQSSLTIVQDALPAVFPRRPLRLDGHLLSARGGWTFSAFHRIASDELWHFYAGCGLIVYVIDPAGIYSELQLGSDFEAGEVFQAVVKAGCWFASRLRDSAGFALVGCTVAPGFDFADFEMAKRSELIAAYPQHRKLIEELTRQ